MHAGRPAIYGGHQPQPLRGRRSASRRGSAVPPQDGWTSPSLSIPTAGAPATARGVLGGTASVGIAGDLCAVASPGTAGSWKELRQTPGGGHNSNRRPAIANRAGRQPTDACADPRRTPVDSALHRIALDRPGQTARPATLSTRRGFSGSSQASSASTPPLSRPRVTGTPASAISTSRQRVCQSTSRTDVSREVRAVARPVPPSDSTFNSALRCRPGNHHRAVTRHGADRSPHETVEGRGITVRVTARVEHFEMSGPPGKRQDNENRRVLPDCRPPSQQHIATAE